MLLWVRYGEARSRETGKNYSLVTQLHRENTGCDPGPLRANVGSSEVESLLWLPWAKQVQDWLLCVVPVGPKAGPG